MKSKNLICTTVIFSLQLLAACARNTQPEIVDTIPVVINTEAFITTTPIPTNSSTPSPTPQPTFSLQEKTDWIAELQADNGGCSYPCWWGIIPGITTWDEAEGILSPIASKELLFTDANDMRMYYLEFPDVSHIMVVDIFVQANETVDVIRFGSNFSLVGLLQIYGRPNEILISSDGIVPGPSEFRIVFFYPEYGIMAAYFGQSSLISHGGDKYIKMCVPDFNDIGPLWLWNPDSNKSFDELPIENLVGSPITLPGFHPSMLVLKRISEYTNYDETSFFYSTMANPEITCLETKADIWPNPDLYTTPTP